ncbi:MAG: S8 family serine peptidase, partial [Emcibacter sp.]|nr:S8 family serine peptidase [Emcibacter sp.]
MIIFNKRFSLSATIITLCLALTACGSSSPVPRPPSALPPPPPPPPPPPSGSIPADFETAEYNADWSLGAINASDAFARGFTGEGAIVGFVDFNFELSNSEVVWHPLSQGKDQQWVDMYEAFLGVETPDLNHGQWVSTIAAARKNGSGLHGVAFDAQVLAVDFFSGVDVHTEVQDGITFFVSDPWGYVVNNGARVVNKSIGFDEEDFIPNPPARDGNEHYVLTNSARVVELGGLLVASAGNDGDPDPMVSNIETLDIINQFDLWASGGFFLVAGSINENGVISDFSDRAGVLKDFYLVAPGEDVAVSSFEFTPFGIGSGTSFASPHIVGAAALLFGQWPQLQAFEVADILLTTATDLGALGVDDIYGHGLLNLDEATKPVGLTSVAVNGAVSPVSVGGSMMLLGAAFGDASPQNLSSVMILD